MHNITVRAHRAVYDLDILPFEGKKVKRLFKKRLFFNTPDFATRLESLSPPPSGGSTVLFLPGHWTGKCR